MVVLKECEGRPQDEFQTKEVEQYRVLDLAEGRYRRPRRSLGRSRVDLSPTRRRSSCEDVFPLMRGAARLHPVRVHRHGRRHAGGRRAAAHRPGEREPLALPHDGGLRARRALHRAADAVRHRACSRDNGEREAVHRLHDGVAAQQDPNSPRSATSSSPARAGPRWRRCSRARSSRWRCSARACWSRRRRWRSRRTRVIRRKGEESMLADVAQVMLARARDRAAVVGGVGERGPSGRWRRS
jgi:hypothetical protein